LHGVLGEAFVKSRRPGRARRYAERILLGALMSVAAFVVERRLRKALTKEPAPEEPERTAEIG
jgi:hypothetical protein